MEIQNMRPSFCPYSGTCLFPSDNGNGFASSRIGRRNPSYRIRRGVRVGKSSDLSTFVDVLCKGIRTAQRTQILHPLLVIPQKRTCLGPFRETKKGEVDDGEWIGNPVQGKSGDLPAAVQNTRPSLISRSQINDLAVLPKDSVLLGPPR